MTTALLWTHSLTRTRTDRLAAVGIARARAAAAAGDAVRVLDSKRAPRSTANNTLSTEDLLEKYGLLQENGDVCSLNNIYINNIRCIFNVWAVNKIDESYVDILKTMTYCVVIHVMQLWFIYGGSMEDPHLSSPVY